MLTGNNINSTKEIEMKTKATDHKATDHKATDHFAWLPQGAKAKLGVRYAAHQTRTRSDIYNTVQ